LVEESVWKELTAWLTDIKKEYAPKRIIGSGGNINTLFKLSYLRDMAPMTKRTIKKLYKQLKNLSYDEKISKLGLRPDRADVIIPATELFLFAMSKSGCREVIVPKVGLVDGIMHQLYDEHKRKES
jgi:exopolyphosphatase/guanosine-5'-triphosphate,3'-diphosphate pyrophosphatase